MERERIRLEKERRELAEQEAFFYDFQDLKYVYDFDLRHKKHLKADGIFRQGLQWTPEELEAFLYRYVNCVYELGGASFVHSFRSLFIVYPFLGKPCKKNDD